MNNVQINLCVCSNAHVINIRNILAIFSAQFNDLLENETFFYQNFHMDRATFDMIFEKIEKHLTYKVNTRPTDRITAKMRFAIVLEYLASGTIGRHMSSIYRVSQCSFGKIIDQVCNAITTEFKGEFMQFTNENWLATANDFNYKWNFPNCLGGIDGRHVPIVCPPNSGSLFFNYKVDYSLVMFHSA